MEYLNFNFPVRAHIELSSRCNFRCLTCKHAAGNLGQDMADNICDAIIKEMLPHLNELEMQGTGEALLNRNFERVFDAASQNGQCHIVLITNASLLNDRMIQKFVRSNMRLVFSIDGPDSDFFSMQRPVGSFDKVVEMIELVRDERRKMTNLLFSSEINMVLTRLNMTALMDMVDFAYRMCVDHLFVSEVRNCMENQEYWELLRLDNIDNRMSMIENIEKARNYACKLGLGFTFNPIHHATKNRRKICISPWQHIYINAKGDVSFCCELGLSLGSIAEKTFREVWNGAIANIFRNNMLIGEYHPSCLKCCLPWGIAHD